MTDSNDNYKQDNSLAKAIYTIMNLYYNMTFFYPTSTRGKSPSKKKKKKKKKRKKNKRNIHGS